MSVQTVEIPLLQARPPNAAKIRVEKLEANCTYRHPERDLFAAFTASPYGGNHFRASCLRLVCFTTEATGPDCTSLPLASSPEGSFQYWNKGRAEPRVVARRGV